MKEAIPLALSLLGGGGGVELWNSTTIQRISFLFECTVFHDGKFMVCAGHRLQ